MSKIYSISLYRNRAKIAKNDQTSRQLINNPLPPRLSILWQCIAVFPYPWGLCQKHPNW